MGSVKPRTAGFGVLALGLCGSVACGLTQNADSLSSVRQRSAPPPPEIDVLTQHGDTSRTGANLSEAALDTASVQGNFGKLFSLPVDDAIYAQPLYVSSLAIPGQGTHDVLFVATVGNSLYAFDADQPGPPLWQRSFNEGGRPVYRTDVGQGCRNYRDFAGNIGIVGTPVIDPGSWTLYLVARTVENGQFVQRLRAVDARTGQETASSPLVISGSVPGTGDGSAAGVVAFDPKTENQRAGLLLASGVLYVAWSSHCDTRPYHGWIEAFDAATLTPLASFATTPNTNQGGIWQAGGGLAVDEDGFIYAATGNGPYDGVTEFGQSFIKLAPRSLGVVDWFTPANWAGFNDTDTDFGSGGILRIPGTNLLAATSKTGKITVVDRTGMGQLSPSDAAVHQVFQADFAMSPLTPHLHGGPTYWAGPNGNWLYVWGENDFLRAFALGGDMQFDPTPVSVSTMPAVQGMPGGMLSLSALGSAVGSGILWAVLPLDGNANQAVRHGVLRAFDASDLTHQLWSSDALTSDDSMLFAKFVAPTVANGKLYLATFSNQVEVYGLGPPGLPASGTTVFSTGFEPSDAQPMWSNAPDTDYNDSPKNVVGFLPGVDPQCSISKGVAHGGQSALAYAGTADGWANTFDYFKVYPVDIPVTSTTTLSYWIYPEQDNARYAGVDLHFTDGTTLRDSGSVDQYGFSMHPNAGHGGQIPLGDWTQIQCNIGLKLSGKTIDKIWVAFDRPNATGQFSGYVDDIAMTQ